MPGQLCREATWQVARQVHAPPAVAADPSCRFHHSFQLTIELFLHSASASSAVLRVARAGAKGVPTCSASTLAAMSLDHSDCELPEAQQESPEQQPQQLDELVAASPEPAAAEPEQAPEPGPEMQEETDPLEQQAAVSAEPQQAASLAIESAAAAAGRAVVVMPPAQPLQHQRQQTQETVCSVNQSQHQTHPSR